MHGRPTSNTLLHELPRDLLAQIVSLLGRDEQSKASLALCNRSLHGASKTWSTRLCLCRKSVYPLDSFASWLRARPNTVQHITVFGYIVNGPNMLNLVLSFNSNSVRTVDFASSYRYTKMAWPYMAQTVDLDVLPKLESIRAAHVQLEGVCTALTSLQLTPPSWKESPHDLAAVLPRLPNLRQLTLRWDPGLGPSQAPLSTSVTSLFLLDTFRQYDCRLFPNLLSLDMGHTTPRTVCDVLAGLPGLRQLTIHTNGPHRNQNADKEWIELVHANLTSLFIRLRDKVSMTPFIHLPALRRMHVELEDEGANMPLFRPEAPLLTYLSFEGDSLLALDNCPRLATLCAASNALWVCNCLDIEPCASLTSIRHLYLHNYREVTPRAFKALACMTRLSGLYINQVSDDIPISLESYTELRSLSLVSWAPRVVLPPSLERLYINLITFDPALIKTAPRLTRLGICSKWPEQRECLEALSHLEFVYLTGSTFKTHAETLNLLQEKPTIMHAVISYNMYLATYMYTRTAGGELQACEVPPWPPDQFNHGVFDF